MSLMAHKRGELPDLWQGIEPTHSRLEDDDHLEAGEEAGYLSKPQVY